MSHTVKCELKCKSKDAVLATIKKMGLKQTAGTSHRTFDRKTIDGIAFRLPGWRQDVIIGDDHSVNYDNYGERWGKTAELDKFLAQYSVEAVRLEAAANGFSVDEYTNAETGQIELIMEKY